MKKESKKSVKSAMRRGRKIVGVIGASAAISGLAGVYPGFEGESLLGRLASLLSAPVIGTAYAGDGKSCNIDCSTEGAPEDCNACSVEGMLNMSAGDLMQLGDNQQMFDNFADQFSGAQLVDLERVFMKRKLGPQFTSRLNASRFAGKFADHKKKIAGQKGKTLGKTPGKAATPVPAVGTDTPKTK